MFLTHAFQSDRHPALIRALYTMYFEISSCMNTIPEASIPMNFRVILEKAKFSSVLIMSNTEPYSFLSIV